MPVNRASFVVACSVLETLEIDIKDFLKTYSTKAENEAELLEQNDKPARTILDSRKRAAILTKTRNNKERRRQIELIKEKCSDIEIVKEYHSSYTNIEKQYDQILLDAKDGVFDLLITTYVRKLSMAKDDDAMLRVYKLAETGIACYFPMDSFYYCVKSDGTIVKGII